MGQLIIPQQFLLAPAAGAVLPTSQYAVPQLAVVKCRSVTNIVDVISSFPVLVLLNMST
jgi:hypothetical protein